MPRVGLFGGVTVRFKDSIVSSNLGRRANELFAYLILYKSIPHRREKLAELVWPESAAQKSRSALNTTIWRLNRLFDIAGLRQHLLLDTATQTSIKLELSPAVYVDCHSLQESVRQSELAIHDRGSLSIGEYQVLRDALDQYVGMFLEGYDSEWILRERERLHCLFIRGQTLLMHALTGQGRYEEALECGRAMLATDEMREVVQREVMWLYVMNGQRGEAIAQYRKFHARVKQELGIEPMSETTALYRHILCENESPALLPSGKNVAPTDMTAVRDFLRECERNRVSMYSALIQRDRPEG